MSAGALLGWLNIQTSLISELEMPTKIAQNYTLLNFVKISLQHRSEIPIEAKSGQVHTFYYLYVVILPLCHNVSELFSTKTNLCCQ